MDEYSELSSKEKKLVSLWRSLQVTSIDVVRNPSLTIEVTIQDHTPDIFRVYHDFDYRFQPPGDHELTPNEIAVIQKIRSMEYGRIYLKIEDFQPALIMGNSFEQFKL